MRLGGLQKCSLIDYPGKLSAIIFTIGCNFRCPYCHNPELVDETAEEISEAAFFQFLETRIGKLDAVTITGGEPTMHEDLLPFLGRIKELGFLIKLDSNGTRSDVLKGAIEQQLVDYIAMDIKAPLHKYEGTVARPVDCAEIKKSIALLKEGQVAYEFRTTVIKSLLSIEDFHAIGNTITGAQTYYLQKFIPTKLLNPAFIRKTTYTDSEFAEIKSIMDTYVKTCNIR
jgi:pyruvate formate lyase activating enzyme